MTSYDLFEFVLLKDKHAKRDFDSITAGGHLDLCSLTTLPEGVTLSAGGNLYLQSLTTLPENVTLSAGGHLDLCSLTTLPEGVTLSAGGYLNLRSLTTLPKNITLSAGGNLYLRSLTTLPKNITLSAGGYILTNHINQSWRGKSLRSIDGCLMEIVSTSKRDGITIHNARYFGKEESCRVAERDGIFAHGGTAKEAVEDLLFKCMNRDIATVVAEIKSTGKVTRMQYRAITGACKEGTRRFLESHGMDSLQELPLADALRLTEGAYGFAEFRDAVAFQKEGDDT